MFNGNPLFSSGHTYHDNLSKALGQNISYMGGMEKIEKAINRLGTKNATTFVPF